MQTMQTMQSLPTINSYKDLINFNNSLPKASQVLDIERVSYAKNIITVNGETIGIDRFLYNYIKNPKYLTGKVHRLKDYNYSKLFLLLHPDVFLAKFRPYLNNITLVGEKKLTLWDFEIGIDTDGITITKFHNITAEEVVIPYFITRIDEKAFNEQYTLRKVVIQEGSMLKSIGKLAFRHCKNLKDINIPDSVTELGRGCFCGTGLEIIVLPSKLKIVTHAAFNKCEKLRNIVFPESLISIEDFSLGYTSLESVILPAHLESIGYKAFENCKHLSNIVFNEGLKKIEANAFEKCDMLRKIRFPDSLTHIGEEAFKSCHNLEIITIGKGIRTIGEGAFLYCFKLK